MPFEAGTIWSFSSGDMPPEERAASVRSLRERGILHLKPLPDLTARVEITKYALPGVKILAGTLSGLLQIGNPNDPGGQDDLFLGINLTSKSTFANLAGKSSSVAAKRPFFRASTMGLRPTYRRGCHSSAHHLPRWAWTGASRASSACPSSICQPRRLGALCAAMPSPRWHCHAAWDLRPLKRATSE